MNGFEPLRRRITDYTVAGQWQEVYDGPIEECEEFRLKAENESLRKAMDFQALELGCMTDNRDVLHVENARLRELVRDMWRLLLATGNDDLILSIEVNGAVKEVIDADELAKTMRDLGIEVDDD